MNREIKVAVSADEIVQCLLAEYKYWRDADGNMAVEIGAVGAISNVLAFATSETFRAPWHPEKPDQAASPAARSED